MRCAESASLIRGTAVRRAARFGRSGSPRQEPIRAAALRQDLYAWMARVRERRGGAGEQVVRTKEQCENMRSLGYVDAACR
jgi:hypothetical protein